MAKRKGTRRGNNEGSIFQRKDGSWIGQITIGYTDNGNPKRKSFYGKTRAEVALKMTTDLNTIMKNGYKTISNEKFETLFMDWLLVFKRNTVQPRTFERIISNVRTNIISEIGEFKLDEFSPQLIQRFINQLYMKGLSLDVIKKSKQIVSQFFEYAIDSGLANTNPTAKIKIQKRDKHIQKGEKYKAIPTDVRQEFLNKLEQHEFLHPLCSAMMLAGLRIGEALALTWRNIDFEQKLIDIKQAITVDTKIDKLGNTTKRTTVIADTKTACSVRVVPMPEKLFEILKKWRETRWIQGKEQGIDLLAPESLVFGNTDGSVRTYYGTNAIFHRFLKKINMHQLGIHFHSFRQTFSNIMFENNVNPKITQMLLGHKEVSTTIRNYNSVDNTYFTKTANIINEQFK